MTVQHQELAAGRWQQMSILEQMANIGSEVSRALNWRAKKNEDYSQRAFERALELIDLTLAGTNEIGRLRELARLREALVDYFFGTNEYASTDEQWRKYFLQFNFAIRKNY